MFEITTRSVTLDVEDLCGYTANKGVEKGDRTSRGQPKATILQKGPLGTFYFSNLIFCASSVTG